MAGMALTKTELRQAAKRARSLSTRLKTMRRKTERVTERVVHSAEVGAAAFTAGIIQGRTGGVEVLGVPLELGLGVTLNLAGFMGLGGRMSNHLHGFGDGFLAAYLTTLGRGLGVSQRASGVGLDTSLSDRELAEAAEAAAS